MSPDPQAAATKADIAMLMQEMGKLYNANERWKEELKSHFDVALEHAKFELLGAHKDKVSMLNDTALDHTRRITRLERHAGIAA